MHSARVMSLKTGIAPLVPFLARRLIAYQITIITTKHRLRYRTFPAGLCTKFAHVRLDKCCVNMSILYIHGEMC